MRLTIQRKPIRTLRIRVLPDASVIVSAPKRLSDKYIQNFIETKKDRILKAQERMNKARKAIEVKDNEILLHAIPYLFTLDSSVKNNILIDHEEFTITSGVDLMKPAKQKLWYKAYAKTYLQAKLDELALKHGFSYEKLFVRDQKTKWGTCSSQKNIGLNWKLIKMPEDIIEYVICHELAHLREMNHSKRFWAVVESICPKYKDAEKRMKKYGLSLQ